MSKQEKNSIFLGILAFVFVAVAAVGSRLWLERTLFQNKGYSPAQRGQLRGGTVTAPVHSRAESGAERAWLHGAVSDRFSRHGALAQGPRGSARAAGAAAAKPVH